MKKTLSILLFTFAFITIKAQDNKINLLIGTYTNTCESKGIYVYEFDLNTAAFSLKNTTENVVNPSYLSVSADSKFVYSVNENGKKSMVSAFKFNASNGKLDLINSQDSKGADPCYIINDDKNVIAANYSGGNISVFGKNSDSSLTEAKQVLQYTGKGINTKRQESPHLHMVYFSPDKQYVLASDLGTDKVYLYQYNSNSASEVLQLKNSVDLKPGSGPRHLTFSKNGKFVYVLQELDGTLTTFSYANGMLKKVDENSIVTKDFKGNIGSADIHVSPDGKFLYATNRGTANDISAFKILKSGKLELVQRTSTLGKGPRNFAIDPSGNFLLVAHQYSNEVVVFRRNKKTGLLTDTEKKIALCAPVCLVFNK